MKDLTGYLAPDLVIKAGEHTFTVRPPTKDTGLKLAAINAAGANSFLAAQDQCPACGRAGDIGELPEDLRGVYEQVKHVELGRLSLGDDVYEDMVAKGLPAADIDTLAVYALYYWVLGEQLADSIMEQALGGGAAGEARTSASSTSKPGPRTASGNRTQRRASTRRTGASRRG